MMASLVIITSKNVGKYWSGYTRLEAHNLATVYDLLVAPVPGPLSLVAPGVADTHQLHLATSGIELRQRGGEDNRHGRGGEERRGERRGERRRGGEGTEKVSLQCSLRVKLVHTYCTCLAHPQLHAQHR